ncbi:unnamed protein product [Adineta ricciae]|uniref:Uncharacterized protein n=1 Tax=Adineta ricciae TaxID=249248 RepID=A0A815Y7N0_ADIRI|nr:unnamed protein product [Adineta ricciae]
MSSNYEDVPISECFDTLISKYICTGSGVSKKKIKLIEIFFKIFEIVQSRRMLFGVIVFIQSVWGLLIDKKTLVFYSFASKYLPDYFFSPLKQTIIDMDIFQVNVIEPIPIENEQELEEANWEHSPSIQS